jgi:diguanylate cyclase (GGDEF)-like protein/PAS domain S-box-containing protein
MTDADAATAAPASSYKALATLHARTAAALAEAEAALAAVGAKGVDALVSGSGGDLELLTLPEPSGHPEFFRTLVAAMQEGAASLDAGGTVLYANTRLAELLGVPLERVVGRALAELAADASGLDVTQLLAQAARGPARAALELRRGDGGRVPVEVSAAPLAGGEGELCLLVTDMTIERLVSAELRRERAALAQAQAIGGVGSWEWDLDSGESRWSAEQFRLHGLDPGDGAPAQPAYLARVHPDDRAAYQTSWDGHLQQRGEHVQEYRFEHPALGTRTLLVHSDFLPAELGGKAAGLAGTCQDVTDERLARSALQAAEERFRCSFDEARIGMMILDLDGHYSRVNDAFCEIVGYSHEQLATLWRENITHPDDIAADAAAVRSLLANEATSHSSEKRYLHASGHLVWAAINLTLIRDAGGQPLHFIAQVQDITGRRSYERQLEHMADHDPLTGLLNRRSFARELSSHSARIARYGATGAVLMLDLDNFKYFNDTRGHSAGDALIVRIAQRLQSRLRASDVLARLGGDEFAVLLPHDDEDESRIVADVLLQIVSDEAMPMVMGEHKRVTASVGIARFDDGPGLTDDEIMVNADLAMYDAKEGGRNQWARYRTEQHDRPKIESRMKWVEQINDAIANDGFELLAQPIVPFRAHGPAQYELLLRMRDVHGDLIPPASFLYVAERLGMIREIDHWVTNRAIDMLAEHRAAGRDLRLEVNLSGHTTGDEDLLELVERRLRETGVPPDRLVFEITETAAIANIARAAAFAQRLAGLGCRFALDDFGAGFGSFYYLKHLPFDYLKIDGEYVRHCAENETDRILIAAVVQIARGMGKSTIAEFVTNQETVEVLTRLGVDYGQGYHLGRPQPLEHHLAAAATPAPGVPERGPAAHRATQSACPDGS